MKKISCPKCNQDISANEFSQDSPISGWLDIGYECNHCKIDIYVYKIEKQTEE